MSGPYDLPFGKPLIDEHEKNAVLEVLSGTQLVHGPKATEFENDFAAFTQSPHAVSVSSCTAGMHLIYFHLGYGPGDEIIVPAQTHTATAHAVELVGATPVFVDADPHTGNLDTEKLEAAITPKTRAIAVVHYLGLPVNMAPVLELAKAHGLFVLEDCALAVGSYYQGTHAGLLGDAGVYSFYPVKHMTTAEGGMIITRDAELAQALKLKKAFGVDRNYGERRIPGLYDVVHLGLNYRMSELHAALGIEQLKKLPAFLRQRKSNYWQLHEALKSEDGITLFKSSHDHYESSYYCFSVVLSESLAQRREAIMTHLKNRGVGTSIYYPHAVPEMHYYREKYALAESTFIEAKTISDRSIALPVGPHLSSSDMSIIAEEFLDAIAQHRKA